MYVKPKILALVVSVIFATALFPGIAVAEAEGNLAVGGVGDTGAQLSVQAYTGDGLEAVQVSAYGTHAAAILSDGSLWTWGSGSKPTKVMTDAVSVDVGSSAFAAIKSDGSLWMWGSGYFGNGSRTTQTSPAKVMDGVKQVSVGINHTAAVKMDGSLWTWGSNEMGQIGDGAKTARTSPFKAMADVANVSAGGWSTAAVKTDGTLWLWGEGAQAAPTQIASGVTQASAAVFASAAHDNLGYVKTDGTLWVRSGEQSASRRLDGVSSAVMGLTHYAALKKDGTLWTWGNNERGQIGDGTVADRSDPVKVLEGVAQVAVGGMQYSIVGSSFTVALKGDGTIWAWGANVNGQLGDGTTEDKASPICLFRDGVWLSNDTCHFADEVPEHEALLHFLWPLYWYDNGETGASREYDSAIAVRYSTNIISNLTWHAGVSVANASDGTYPVDVFLGRGSKAGDPHGKFDEYNICDGEGVEWVVKNVFNVNSSDYLALRDSGDMPAWKKYYYYDGKYYTQTGGIGGWPYHDVAVLSAKRVGDRYNVFFRVLYGDRDPSTWEASALRGGAISSKTLIGNVAYLYAQVGLKAIDGKQYWSLYKLSENPIPSSVDEPAAFTIGRDTNQYTNSNSRKSGGFFGWRNYRMTKALRERMQAFILANSGNPKADVIELWDGELSEWGGSCFGMASTMSLLYGDAVEPADLSPGTQASSYYGIGSTNGNAAFAHAVNYYHLSQCLSTTAFDVYCEGNVMDAVNAYNEIQIAVGKDGPGVLCYYYKGQDGKSHGHAVVACGVERSPDGSFSLRLFDGNTYSGDSQGSFKRITVRPLELSVEGEGISPQSFCSFGYVGIGGLIPAKPYGGDAALATQAAGTGAGQSVSFDADSTFELSLADGSTVAYGGGELTGPAQVTKFAVCESGDGKGSVRLYADIGSDAAVEGVDSVDGELDVAVSSEGACFSVEGSGVGGVSVDGEGRLDVDVDDQAGGDVTVCVASESEVYRLSGAAAEDMTITAREDGCSVTATGGGAAVSGMAVQAYSDYAAAEPGASRFTDVGYGSGHPHWVVDDGGTDWLSTAVEAGLMGGYRGTTLFGPDDPITRGQVATVLYRASAADASDTTDPARYAANATPFSDVAGGQYYTAAMNWAYAERIFTGDANGVTVRPGDGITRQELALVLYRYAVANGGPALADASCFSGAPDAADVSAWASAGVAWCYENGIMTGSASTRELSPWGGATRAAMCKMAVVTLGLLGDA